ncbi:serine/threonine-protein kinase haspin homolog [Anopheles marshallii]|uniref:serine/threonine-protein kinase haspin homolog n=1 Tax=Anopheles marshallii TaxID=1521116 RepID=UPI00237B7894|nr:serine/threonine-protein kinase haspin homolog [Anopheles marshallii]
MSTQRRSRAKSRNMALSSIVPIDQSLAVVEETTVPTAKDKKVSTKTLSHSIVHIDNETTIGEKVQFKPGKWRKSLSILRSSICRREGSCSVAGERRITVYLNDHQVLQLTNETSSSDTIHSSTSKQPDDTNDVSVNQFVAPLSWKTVADQRYLCPKSPRNEILARCGQQEPITFEKALASLDAVIERKIGEGVYGEVFMCTKTNGVQSVLKVIPIEGNHLINGEKQKTFDEILSEIIISVELSNLRQHNVQFCTDGFVELRSVRCLVGRYPERLVNLWEEYENKHGTENDSPAEFPNEQLYIAFETAFGGADLDGYRFKNAQQAFSIYAQIVLMLAVAEKRYDFEHRDLHTGNILIEPTKERERTYYLLGEEIIIETHGLKATIIDYTLSRIVYNGLCLFNDLSADEELFTAEGDYQFEVYRNMKTVLQNQWNIHAPKTNVYWLHYLLDKLTSVRNYRDKTSRAHKSAMKTMKGISEVLLQFNSVHEIVSHYFAPQLNESNKEN